jgi:hypothetical protein
METETTEVFSDQNTMVTMREKLIMPIIQQNVKD